MERDRVLSYKDTALSSKKVADMLVLLFLDDNGRLDLNELYNAVINSICQISVKCCDDPEKLIGLSEKFIAGMKNLVERQTNDWQSVKDTCEHSALMSYAYMVNMALALDIESDVSSTIN